ncbi:hypothetical protein GpartN1_g1628.t1 [Galdieria partita]|uniref:Large ribosomal subunit protein uL18 C-terminal eukaryotes domain-containing protein n=1 Tax=Galdieria partita TaxID=83374 RepID=A0A9C7PUG5_9RHOD|nr:hypothetical protein GpartN1_g1628.t1 [Galdieria partita]
MVFVKVVKNKAYFKRFQVKPRRRREGKTDYRARLKLVTQDLRKYASPRYRLVVRFTNRDIICQFVYARLEGDHILSAAYAHELPRYGIKVGLTNFAAAYATGLLLARRTLKKLNLDEVYVGKETVDGEFFEVEPQGERRPFRAYLDVGLIRTTTGNKVFAAMKGVVDGGVDIPHNEKRFPKYTKEEGFNPEELRRRIFGQHIAEYMKLVAEEDKSLYEARFSQYIKAGVGPDDLEEMYKQAHSRIRADPSFEKKPKREVKQHRAFRQRKLTKEEKQENLKKKIEKLAMASMAAGHEEE